MIKKLLVVAALIVGSVGLADAQLPTWAQREAERPWTPDRKLGIWGSNVLNSNQVYLKAETAQRPPDDGYTTFQKVTITLGDFVITADSASIPGDGTIHLGDNVRLVMPVHKE